MKWFWWVSFSSNILWLWTLNLDYLEDVMVSLGKEESVISLTGMKPACQAHLWLIPELSLQSFDPAATYICRLGNTLILSLFPGVSSHSLSRG